MALRLWVGLVAVGLVAVGLVAVGSPATADPPETPPKFSAGTSESTAASPASSPSVGSARLAVLQLRDEVELDSPIVRLADVAQPVGPPPKGWDRAAVASVGLLPTDGRRLRVERQRLSEMLSQSKLLSEPVRWSGPETVSLRYVPAVADATVSAAPSRVGGDAAGAGSISPAAGASAVAQVATYAPPDGSPGGRVQPVAAVKGARSYVPLVPAERNRIRRMIEAAFAQTYAQFESRYELIIDETQENLAALNGLRAIRTLELSGDPGADPLRLVVSGDTELERVEAAVHVQLDELPLVVAATQALKRGDIVAAGDVRLQPVARNRFHDQLIRELKSVVGMEVKRPVSEGRLLDLSDVTAPLVIRRGDLVEVRVVGGGVTVTTAARALEPAAAGEPVSVETQTPRRKLIGRAVAGGVVEIVTRPPTVSDSSP